ncbi:SUF system Fe-S cluster assembly regulator [Pacificimonas flava]|uniref:Iron-sulfur cluster regulator IscR n=1 Tax=Pacificimonas flava TaxID=1234595 RepID=M2TP72_9SPHN|nr:SUF system Fe-S cluster assembly regulator [Pacificimonas flava]EMD83561.1 Iron-sulfur cluster regulator IscR [Pacificimonas flava]MBB5278888.1 FeS assembly SUF system regulator [Pacificimonas flava]
MIRLSNLADYAVVAMVALARSGDRLNAADLGQKSGIPAPTAQKLAGLLTRAGLLASVRGAGGGVHLARRPQAIRLTEIIEAVDGPIGLTQCLHEGAEDCIVGANCSVKPHWTLINARVRAALSDVTLAELMQRAPVAAGGASVHEKEMA